jgi:geranylgeranyl reductase family protein
MTSGISAEERDADVVVVGAGPGGATTAYYLAQAGLDVLVLEKSRFPREKVCGDGLTPRAVKALVGMGVDVGPDAGWARNKGLRVIGGGLRLELDWPDLASYPDFGLVRPRLDFDQLLADRAQKAGARLREGVTVTGATTSRSGRVTGVTAKVDGQEQTFRAPLVVAADGGSSRLALSVGITKRDDRPMGVAVRRYYTSPRTHDDYLESWLELWDDSQPGPRRLLPGYGWIFGVGDGTSNVGLGILNSSAAFGHTDYRRLLSSWLGGLPAEWGYAEENATGPTRGGGLPMGFNRVPHYRDGLLLVGDAGGVVNPFNGEGIAYAMETGLIAADHLSQALARPPGAARERVLESYRDALRAEYGGYYRLGGVFVKLIGNPAVMRLATRYGLPRPVLMRFVLKLLANLTDRRGGDAADRVISALTRLAPAV